VSRIPEDGGGENTGTGGSWADSKNAFVASRAFLAAACPYIDVHGNGEQSGMEHSQFKKLEAHSYDDRFPYKVDKWKDALVVSGVASASAMLTCHVADAEAQRQRMREALQERQKEFKDALAAAQGSVAVQPRVAKAFEEMFAVESKSDFCASERLQIPWLKDSAATANVSACLDADLSLNLLITDLHYESSIALDISVRDVMLATT
jgi:hypothetical protein